MLKPCKALSSPMLSEIFVTNHILDLRSEIGLSMHKVLLSWITARLDPSGCVPSASPGGRRIFVEVMGRRAHWCSNELVLVDVVGRLLSHWALHIPAVS